MGIGPFSSESTSRVETFGQNAAFSEISGGAANYGLVARGKNSVINVQDQGSLSLARDIATSALNQVELAGSNTASAVRSAIGAVSESEIEESENLMGNFKTIAIVGVVIWGIVMVAKGRK